MIKRILPIALLGAALIFNTGCNSGNGFKKLKGIEYKIVTDKPGKKAAIGDIVEFNILAKVDTGVNGTMVLGDSRKSQDGKPAVARVDSTKSGQWQAVFPMLSVGDSAIVEVSCDTLIANMPKTQQQLPPWLKKGKKISVYISIVSIKSMDDYKKDMDAKQADMQNEMKAKAAQQMPVDDKMLQDYFAKNNIKAQKTESGLYYTIEKEGTGPKIAAGQSVTLNYTGKILGGATFDSNEDSTFHHKQPFEFVPGSGGVIKGWEEGVLLLKNGSKATLYIPSPLAYGTQSPAPTIPANSILVFTMQVTNVKAGTAKPGMSAAQ